MNSIFSFLGLDFVRKAMNRPNLVLSFAQEERVARLWCEKNNGNGNGCVHLGLASPHFLPNRDADSGSALLAGAPLAPVTIRFEESTFSSLRLRRGSSSRYRYVG
jgi:hypothetical protein